MQSSDSPLSRFQTLALELVFQICSYLDHQQLANILPTCKYLNTAVSRYLYDETTKITLKVLSEAKSHNDPYRSALWRLTSAFSEIKFTGEGRGGERVEIDLIDALETLLKEKKKAVNVDLKVNSSIIQLNGHRDVLLALKAFSYTRPASEFAISSLTGELNPNEITQVFDVRKLTKLNLSFEIGPWSKIPKYESAIVDTRSDEYRNATAEGRLFLREKASKQYENPLPEMLGTIASLNKLFVRARNLMHLHLNPIMHHYKKFRPLKILPPELEEFRETFANLTLLRSFRLDNFLFHVSFFLPIPQSVEWLNLKNIHYYSKAWWMEFGKYKFPSLTALYLEYDSLFRQYTMYETDTDLLHRDGSFKTPDEIEHGFQLGNVEIQSLEKFSFERTHSYPFNKHFCFPTDLIQCIVKKNPRLEPQTRRALANHHAEATIEICCERMQKVIENCRGLVKSELVDEFMEGGPQDDDLEKCLSLYVRHLLGKSHSE